MYPPKTTPFLSLLAVCLLIALSALALSAGASFAAPSQAISTVPAPAHAPRSLAVNPDANRLYVLSWSGPPQHSPTTSVVALDASTHSMVGVADALYILPYDIAVDATRGRVFATNHDGLAIIDASTTKLQRWAALPANLDLTRAVAVSPSTGKVYLASELPTPVINVIDPASWGVSQQIKLPGSLARGLVVNPATNRLYVVTTRPTQGIEGAVSAIDLGTNELIDLPQVGATSAPPALDLTHNRLYLGRWQSRVSAVDATTYDEVGTSGPLSADDSSDPVIAVGVDPELQHVYAMHGQQLTVLDATTPTLSEIAHYDLPHALLLSDGIRPLVVNTRTHRVYWTTQDDTNLAFFQDTDARAPSPSPAPEATATPVQVSECSADTQQCGDSMPTGPDPQPSDLAD